MRVTNLEISGFRGFSRGQRLDLDGDVVLVTGANGQGKTSLFDAIHWGITGEISRLQSPESVISLYSDSGEARVEVGLVSEDGQRLAITRRFDGQTADVLLTEGRDSFRGNEAELELLRRLWPQGLAARDQQAALRSVVERGVYLQQDVLTGFLTADTDQKRFTVISELIGAGRVTELQATIESSRRAWTRVTTGRTAAMEQIERRLARLQEELRVASEGGGESNISRTEWDVWWDRALALGVAEPDRCSVDSPDAPGAIDAAMRQLRVIRLSLDHRQQRLRPLADRLRALADRTRPTPPSELELDGLRQSTREAAAALAEAREELTEAERVLADITRRRLAARSEGEELRTLAELALRHLGERCPICEQAYDADLTRDRLESLVQDSTDHLGQPESLPDLAELTERARTMEARASRAEAELEDSERRQWMQADEEAEIRAYLAELDIEIPEGADPDIAVGSARDANESDIASLVVAVTAGEQLALSLARAGQLARRSEVEREVQSVRLDVERIRREIAARSSTGDLVSSMIDGLREASLDLVGDELATLEPLLQRIYSTADPHPAFRVARLLSRMRQGRGRILAELEDTRVGLRRESPQTILSSSQMNVLAVSVFLALNLGMPMLPLKVAILDDPLQSLDDLNLLGLIDLLRRTRDRRQLMVSTHDSRFASLLQRKLRPVVAPQRTIVIEFHGWSIEGPSVVQRDIGRDRVPLRIAAA